MLIQINVIRFIFWYLMILKMNGNYGHTTTEYPYNVTNIKEHPNWPSFKDGAGADIECGQSFSADRIIGGINASLGQYPWIARIGYNKKSGLEYECGGALISEQHVLTAAHCVVDLEPNVAVRSILLGENNAETEVDCNAKTDECADPPQKFKPKRIIYPANYNNPQFKHDIAIIQLNRKAILSEWVLPVCLPYGEALTLNLTGQIAEVAGWGLTKSEHERGTNYLQTVKMPILDLEECKRIYGPEMNITTAQLCVGGEMRKDSCGGDSGGPLVKVVAGQKGPTYFIYGIVSFGSKRCGETKTPGIYTDIKYYLTWILENIKYYNLFFLNISRFVLLNIFNYRNF